MYHMLLTSSGKALWIFHFTLFWGEEGVTITYKAYSMLRHIAEMLFWYSVSHFVHLPNKNGLCFSLMPIFYSYRKTFSGMLEIFNTVLFITPRNTNHKIQLKRTTL